VGAIVETLLRAPVVEGWLAGHEVGTDEASDWVDVARPASPTSTVVERISEDELQTLGKRFAKDPDIAEVQLLHSLARRRALQ
jgi:hypothetical protein